MQTHLMYTGMGRLQAARFILAPPASKARPPKLDRTKNSNFRKKATGI